MLRISSTKTVISQNGAVGVYGAGRRLAEYDRWRMSWNGNMFAPPDSSGCVLYYPGHPGQGTTITDFSGSANHGTIVGAIWKRRPSGVWYLDFDGSDDKVTVTASASIAKLFDAGGTIDVWINPRSDGEIDSGRVFDKRPAATGWCLYGYGETAGKIGLVFRIDFATTDGQWNTTAKVVPINAWSKFTLTYNSSNVANDPIIYLNGASVAITEGITPVGTRVDDTGEALCIGNNSAQTVTFDGGLALCKAQKSIKTADQIAQDFQREKHLFGV